MVFVRNRELQYYTKDDKDNVRIENGCLVIEAHQEKMENAAYEASANEDEWQKKRAAAEYTSGSITTHHKANWTYGRFEIRAKLPSGKGTWPAIWMLGESPTQSWPDCGEIDIMENVGYDPLTIHANVHTADYNHQLGTNRGANIKIDSPSEEFHVYAIDWNSERIQFFIDDALYFTYYNEDSGENTWPFDHPHYLLLNLAIGGSWGGEQGIDPSIFPQRMEVDYVRIYQ
jgi:beta-glucanase (GH16 family)